MRAFTYVGPEAIRLEATKQPRGREIHSVADLRDWLTTNPEGISEAATFIVNLAGTLVHAPRRSEHVACAGGHDVLAAGEIRFRGSEAIDVTNQSTGYCPDAACWPAVKNALDRAGITAPNTWSRAFVFRHCAKCGELNIVKDDWFVCAICDASLD